MALAALRHQTSDIRPQTSDNQTIRQSDRNHESDLDPHRRDFMGSLDSMPKACDRLRCGGVLSMESGSQQLLGYLHCDLI